MVQLFLMPTVCSASASLCLFVLECLSHHPDGADTARGTQGCDPSTPYPAPWASCVSSGDKSSGTLPGTVSTHWVQIFSHLSHGNVRGVWLDSCPSCSWSPFASSATPWQWLLGWDTHSLPGRTETEVIGEFSRWERREAAPPLKMQHGNLHVDILSSQFLVENTHFPQQAETCMEHHNSPV